MFYETVGISESNNIVDGKLGLGKHREVAHRFDRWITALLFERSQPCALYFSCNISILFGNNYYLSIDAIN